MFFIELENIHMFAFKSEKVFFLQNGQVLFCAENYFKNDLIFVPLSSVLFQGAGHCKPSTDCCSQVPPTAACLPSRLQWCSLIPLPWNGGACGKTLFHLQSLSEDENGSSAKK